MSAETLRRAAEVMRAESRPQGEYAFCQCDESDHWFDRSICPEPCGSMHDICNECGRIQGFCPIAVEGRTNSDRLALSWLAVADWLERTAVTDECAKGLGARGIADDDPALAVARAYLGETS